MAKKKKYQQNENSMIDDIDAIIQEANRQFFHIHGIELSINNGQLKIEKPEHLPRLNFGDDVKMEIENVKIVQEMRIIAAKLRAKEFGYIGQQPIVTKPFQ